MYFPPRADWNTNERERLTMSNSSDPERAPVLNENQRRHFEVLLSMLEESLQRIETLSSSLSMNGGMSIVKDDLPSTFILEAEPLIASIRARIGRLAAVLELTPRTVSKRRTISALLTAAIIRIEDSSPEQLRGYGTVDPRFALDVAPRLREIRKALALLGSLLGPAETDRWRASVENL
jgi:hypothetical protein